MARPRSEEKRTQILEAATRVVAERGDSAPTAQIAKLAGVSEGSIFTYFETKDDLLNDLHDTLSGELREAVARGFSKEAEGRARVLHAWRGSISWGLANPTKMAALRVLNVSHCVTELRREQGASRGSRFLAEAMGIADDPPGWPVGLFASLMSLTIDLIQKHPRQAERYSTAGVEAFLRAVGRR